MSLGMICARLEICLGEGGALLELEVDALGLGGGLMQLHKCFHFNI